MCHDVSQVKRPLLTIWSDQLGMTQKHIHDYEGYLDTAFMFSYAIGLLVAGDLGDRYNLRHVLATTMLLSAVFVVLFGLGPTFGVSSPVYYGFVWAMNGFAQSAGWPTVVGECCLRLLVSVV